MRAKKGGIPAWAAEPFGGGPYVQLGLSVLGFGGATLVVFFFAGVFLAAAFFGAAFFGAAFLVAVFFAAVFFVAVFLAA
ncbi:MAG: hypothetical protein GX614_05695, partial [Sandaracinaceae bacterium]|nr:hypothetical protein [Sandaracinaceae bacterium]